MNKNLNLCEILKDCPKGTKLYSPILGDCKFEEVRRDSIVVRVGGYIFSINPNATFPLGNIDSKELMLFPSKEQRDWSKFKVKKPKFDPKTFNTFDKVLLYEFIDACWNCDFYSHTCSNDRFPYVCIGDASDRVIPYNEETKHLVGTTKEAPEFYRYWEE